jgi:hypothetical protein
VHYPRHLTENVREVEEPICGIEVCAAVVRLIHEIHALSERVHRYDSTRARLETAMYLHYFSSVSMQLQAFHHPLHGSFHDRLKVTCACNGEIGIQRVAAAAM